MTDTVVQISSGGDSVYRVMDGADVVSITTGSGVRGAPGPTGPTGPSGPTALIIGDGPPDTGDVIYDGPMWIDTDTGNIWSTDE